MRVACWVTFNLNELFRFPNQMYKVQYVIFVKVFVVQCHMVIEERMCQIITESVPTVFNETVEASKEVSNTVTITNGLTLETFIPNSNWFK